MSDPCDLSATRARQLIGTGELSPEDLLESCIAPRGRGQPRHQCHRRHRFRARAPRRRAAAQAVRDGAELGPLHGLPVGIKDLNATEGLRTTWGSLLRRPRPKEGRTHGHPASPCGRHHRSEDQYAELGAGTHTTNKVYGPTHNPFDLTEHQVVPPGLRSGGCCNRHATPGARFGHGRQPSESGDMVRVVGFRPTPGLVPRESRPLNFSHFSVQGPMARSVADVALMMAGLADADRDPLTGPCDPSAFLDLEPVDLGIVRAAWTEDFGGVAPVDNNIRACFQAVIGKLGSSFGTISADDPDFADAGDCFWTLRCVNYLASHTRRYETHGEKLSPNIIANIEDGRKMSLADVAEAEVQWRRIYTTFQDYFEDKDADRTRKRCAGVPHRRRHPKEVNGQPMANYMGASLIRSALTLTGHPVLALPCGLDHLGLPFGVQLVGKRRGDVELLRIAMALETEFAKIPGLERPVPNLEDFTT